MARKYLVPQPAAGTRALPDALIDKMSEPELRCFIASGTWPAWAAAELRRAGFSLRCSDAAQVSADTPDDDRAGDEDDAGSDPARDQTDAEAPPPARAPRAPEPAPPLDEEPPPPPPLAARAPSQAPPPEREPSAERGVSSTGDSWDPRRRVFDPGRPAPEPPVPQPSPRPATDASALDSTDPIAAAKRAAVLRALATRDRRW
jgi:hypothetical protein